MGKEWINSGTLMKGQTSPPVCWVISAARVFVRSRQPPAVARRPVTGGVRRQQSGSHRPAGSAARGPPALDRSCQRRRRPALGDGAGGQHLQCTGHRDAAADRLPARIPVLLSAALPRRVTYAILAGASAVQHPPYWRGPLAVRSTRTQYPYERKGSDAYDTSSRPRL